MQKNAKPNEPLIEKGFLDREDEPVVKQLIKIANKLDQSKDGLDEHLALALVAILIGYDDGSLVLLSEKIKQFSAEHIARLEAEIRQCGGCAGLSAPLCWETK